MSERPKLTALPGAQDDDAASSKKGPTQATRLAGLAREGYELVHTPDGEAFALPKNDAPIARDFRGSRASFRRELAAAYLDITGSVPSSSGMTDALATLEGLAARGREIEPSLRVGRGPKGELVLDLGRSDGLAAVVDASGWRLERTPIVFRRTSLTSSLPTPAQPGSIDALEGLWELAHVGVDDRPLVLAWKVAELIPDIDHGILAFWGESGSGKTTAARTVVELTDPSPAPLRAAPRDLNDWVVGASGSWVVVVDNLSRIDEWFSDALCRVSSGEGLIRRRLHTDSEIAVISLRRCVVLTSIEAGALRDDLAQRLIVAELERLTPEDRRTGSEFAALLEQRRASLLGGLLTLTSRVLAELPSVQTPELPRLTDYGRIVAAVDRVLGTRGFERLSGLEERLAEDVLEGDEVAVAIVRSFDPISGNETLEGTASELLAKLTPEKPSRSWPKTPGVFSHRLRRLAPAFRVVGISISFDREGSERRRVIRIDNGRKSASAASASSAPAWLSEKPADDDAPYADDADAPRGRTRTHADALAAPSASALFPVNHAESDPLADAADAADDVITSDLEGEERGSPGWIAAASAGELARWRDEQLAGETEGAG